MNTRGRIDATLLSRAKVLAANLLVLGIATFSFSGLACASAPGFYIVLERCHACAYEGWQQATIRALKRSGIKAAVSDLSGRITTAQSYLTLHAVPLRKPKHEDWGTRVVGGPFASEQQARQIINQLPTILRPAEQHFLANNSDTESVVVDGKGYRLTECAGNQCSLAGYFVVLVRVQRASRIEVGGTGQAGENREIPTSSVNAPFEDRGACPFECCTYRRWIAERGVIVHKERKAASPAVFRLEKGEWVQALTGVVVTTRPGQARITRPVSLGGLPAKPGELVELLTYGGEGAYKMRYRGRVIEPNAGYVGSLTVITTPKSVWWVKVKNKRGKIGWTDIPDAFGNRDACG